MTKYIRDDNGYRWRYDQRRGRIVCVDDRSEGKAREYDGYVCASLDEGVRLLRQYGYITMENRRHA